MLLLGWERRGVGSDGENLDMFLFFQCDHSHSIRSQGLNAYLDLVLLYLILIGTLGRLPRDTGI